MLIPTEKMVGHDQDWLVARFALLAALFGEEDYAAALSRNRVFQRVQRRIATDFFVQSAMVMLRNPDIMLFLSRNAGIFVLLELTSDMGGWDKPTVELSLARLGRRFAVSRTHVRQLLQAAEAQDLVEINAAQRRITLKPRLLQGLDRFIADGMSNHDLTGAAARRELASKAQAVEPH